MVSSDPGRNKAHTSKRTGESNAIHAQFSFRNIANDRSATSRRRKRLSAAAGCQPAAACSATSSSSSVPKSQRETIVQYAGTKRAKYRAKCLASRHRQSPEWSAKRSGFPPANEIDASDVERIRSYND